MLGLLGLTVKTLEVNYSPKKLHHRFKTCVKEANQSFENVQHFGGVSISLIGTILEKLVTM